MDKINWETLSINPAAIHLLMRYPERINFLNLAQNSNALELCRLNIQHITIGNLVVEEHIFLQKYNYKLMRETMLNTINEELMQNRFHPKNSGKWISWGFDFLENE